MELMYLRRRALFNSLTLKTSTSGSFVTDVVAPLKKLLVSFVPKQNLNGYDKPWVGGSGKNCLDIDALFVAPQGTLYSGDTPYTFPHVLELALKSNTTYTVSSNYTIANKQRIVYVDTATAADAVYKANSVVKTTGSDGILKIGFFDNRTGSEDFLNKTVYLQVEEGSVATDYEPYENICPISGHTECVTEVMGKNLFDKDAVSVGKWLSTTTGLEETANNYVVSDYIPVISGKTVFIPNSNTARRWFYDASKTPKAYLSTSIDQAFTPTENGYIRVSILANGTNAINLETYQIEVGSTATSYEPYQGTSYTTTLGRTVYGGTLDVVSGELVVDKGFAVFDGSETWTKNTRALNAFYTARPQGCKQATTMVSDKFVYVDNVQTLYNTYGACFCGSSMNFNVNPATIGGDAIEDWQAWLADNPLQVVYELATPITYRLTPQEIETLKGQNNFVAEDGASIAEITYWSH